MNVAFFGFAWVAAMTWYYASRPQAFLRRFVPRDEWLSVYREIRRPENRKAMHLMAGLQFAMASVFGLIGLMSGE
jgi:hypothetical protein